MIVVILELGFRGLKSVDFASVESCDQNRYFVEPRIRIFEKKKNFLKKQRKTDYKLYA